MTSRRGMANWDDGSSSQAGGASGLPLEAALYRPPKERAWRPPDDELANSITSAIGLVLSVVGAGLLIWLAAERGTFWHLVGCSVFGTTLIAMYGVSTFYHSVQPGRLKESLRVMDHVCIYLLIAGTYTPFTLTVLGGFWGQFLLVAVWCCAFLGSLRRIVYSRSLDALSSLPYVATGWLAVIALKPIIETVDVGILLWILAGGLFYTFGVVFYVNDRVRLFHAIWHLFVLGGSACHYYAVVTSVLAE